MRKTFTIKQNERSGLRIVAAIALTGSLAAFGCSTNKMPGNGDRNATSAPGSSSGATTAQGTPQALISSSPASGFSASEDAIATLKADEAFKGKYLGQAAPNDGTANTSASLQQVTGQFIPPSATANPQVTVNSSISSPATPAIVSGAGEGSGGGGGGLSVAALPAAKTGGATNATTSAISNTTATPITNSIATPATTMHGTQMINTGIATAPAAASNVTATPILPTSGALTNTAVATTPRSNTNTTAATTNTAATPVGRSVGVTSGLRTVPLPSKSATTTASANGKVATTAAKSSSTMSAPSVSSVRIVNANGTAVVTNAPPSAFQRFMRAIGLRRTPSTVSTTTTPATTTTTTTSTQ